VVKAGRTLTVCTGDLVAVQGDEEQVVALMTGTMMAVRDRPSLAD
jgi:acyl-coenzyme A thioesterase PaaI-like protein